ncbi:MAG TPA: Holliday junction branch migration protein RuvA [Nitrospiria bacterium]|nr:Holliday junction branch migration protein RuvA [Nitrospiria bacterium]
MIASLTGTLREKSDNTVVLDVNGVGYEVTVPHPILKKLPGMGETVNLRIHTHVREDALQLFGFQTEEEKSIFLLVLGVSGIGPRLAVGVLAGMGPGEFVSAVQRGDVARLSSIPGIGKKTAERMALELKEKVKTVKVEVPAGSPGGDKTGRELEDAVSALVNLGYKPPQAREAVRQVLETANGGGVENLVKESLKVLSKA